MLLVENMPGISLSFDQVLAAERRLPVENVAVAAGELSGTNRHVEADDVATFGPRNEDVDIKNAHDRYGVAVDKEKLRQSFFAVRHNITPPDTLE